MRVVGRTVMRAGVTNIQEPISGDAAATSPKSTHEPSSKNDNLSLCSGSGSSSWSSFSASGVPLYGYSRGSNPSYRPSVVGAACYDEYEWVSGHVSEEEIDDFLGPVPSTDEVYHAVSALKSVVKDKFSYDVEKGTNDEISIGTGLLHRVPSAGSEFGWIEPSTHLCNSRALNPHGPSRVYDAFHMLQNDPVVQKTVTSLSSDKAFWEAILNNEAVQELRKAHSSGEDVQSNSENPDAISSANTEHNPAKNVIKPDEISSVHTEHKPATNVIKPDEINSVHTEHKPARNVIKPDEISSADTEHKPARNVIKPDEISSADTEHKPATNVIKPDEISSADTEHNPATNVIKSIFENTKAGVNGLVEKIVQLVNQLFKPRDEKTTAGPSSLSEEKLRSSLQLVNQLFKPHDEKTTARPSGPVEEKLRFAILLSVVVVLIVMMTRAYAVLHMNRAIRAGCEVILPPFLLFLKRSKVSQ